MIHALAVAIVLGAALGGAAWGGEDAPFALAAFGDWPYGVEELATAPLLLDSINGDPDVRLVLHLGDIQAGSMPCAGAGLMPVPKRADPAWSRKVFDVFMRVERPVVYTPGDNEWTDCHRRKSGSSGAPLEELAAIRRLFFATPGRTLGARPQRVQSQAEIHDPAHPADAQFVENVMWAQGGVVFATFNVPGSSNDGVRWHAPFTDEPARRREVAERDGANLRWLERAFGTARRQSARGVVLGMHADLWFWAALVPGRGGLDAYTPLVAKLAELAVEFGGPVLLLNGDAHAFEVDRPLVDPASPTGRIHRVRTVPNLTRITVQGAGTRPRQWLKLTVDPRSPELFRWANVVYCAARTCPN